jgi:phosphatidate cytidylyltransferase
VDIVPKSRRRFSLSGGRGGGSDPESAAGAEPDEAPVVETDTSADVELVEPAIEVVEPPEMPEPAIEVVDVVDVVDVAVVADESGGPFAAEAPRTRAAARAASSPGRAGRNLPAAIGVGLVMGAAVIASLFVRKEAFVVLATLAIVVAVWELTEALAVRSIVVPLVPVAVGAVGMEIAAFATGGQALSVCFGLTCVGILVWRVAEGQDGALQDVAGGLLVSAYLPLLAGFAMLLLAPHDGPWREVTFIVLVIGSDTGGYAAGVLFGRHPMSPSVSPKKSWEGFAGSVIACVLLGVGTVVLFLDGSWWAGALTGLTAVAAATLGDLGESLIKRDLGIKDMGSLLPGHGGVLDRLDSLLFAAPVVWLMLHALVPVT